MTTLTAVADGAAGSAAHALAASLTTVPATGALKLSWLLLAFPLFGAVVLLVGGRRTNPGGTCSGARCRSPRSSTA